MSSKPNPSRETVPLNCFCFLCSYFWELCWEIVANYFTKKWATMKRFCTWFWTSRRLGTGKCLWSPGPGQTPAQSTTCNQSIKQLTNLTCVQDMHFKGYPGYRSELGHKSGRWQNFKKKNDLSNMLLSQISQLEEEANVKILNIWDGKDW